MGVFKAELLAHKAENGAVEGFVFECEPDGRTFSPTEVFDVVLATDGQRVAEKLLLHRRRTFDFLLHALIDLFPESRYGRHTRRVRLAHRLLNLLRIGVQNELSAHREAQISPSALKNMRQGQERHHAVFLGDGHALAVGCHRREILRISQDDTLRVARRAACVDDVAHIVHRRLFPQLFHLRLARQILAKGDEILEIEGVVVVR